MTVSASILAFFRSMKHALLSMTSHARLSDASEPKDFDAILKRMIREVKFYGEALLTIVLYIENRQLESVALACLLFTIAVYIFLEALSGPSLHRHLSNSPHVLSFLALLSKAPALSVFITLVSLAFTQWEHSFVTGVLSILGSFLGIGIAGHAGVHLKFAEAAKKIWDAVCLLMSVKESVDEEEAKAEADEGEDAKSPVGEECV